MSNNLDELKDAEKSSNERNGSVVMAVIFIVAGVGLIVSNLTGFSFHNWWALFMFIPVAFFAQNIYRDYRVNGRLTPQSTGSLIASLAVLAAATVFLFDAITWSAIWPIGLIFAGLAMFLGNRS